MTAVEKRLGCLRVLAACVRGAGKIEGRVRLQKTLYLLKRVGIPELSGIEYVYYHYGPYSADVAEILRDGVAAGVCREAADTYDDEWQRYTYAPGPEAESVVAELPREHLETVNRVISRCKDEHWRTLELAATIDFLQREERIPTDTAEARALELKPPCRPYAAAARRVLTDLQVRA